jgi:hypothetical protein
MNISNQYIAGLIDGEGYIALLPVRKKASKNLTFTPTVKIGMADDSNTALIMEYLLDKFGGHIYRADRSSQVRKDGTRKYNTITWTLRSKKSVGIMLEAIRPYLIIKREQSDLIVEYCRHGLNHPLYTKYDKTLHNRQMEIYQTLKMMHRGHTLATTE